MSTIIRVGAANIVCGVKNAYETVEILSENLNNLMAEHPEFGSNMLLELDANTFCVFLQSTQV